MDLTEIDAVLEKIGEGTIGEGDRTIEFGDLGFAPLGDDTPVIEFSHQLPERLQFLVEAEDGSDGLSLFLVNDELLVLAVVAERHGAAGPFALASAGRDLVPHPLG